jgi:hypothetical protein
MLNGILFFPLSLVLVRADPWLASFSIMRQRLFRKRSLTTPPRIHKAIIIVSFPASKQFYLFSLHHRQARFWQYHVVKLTLIDSNFDNFVLKVAFHISLCWARQGCDSAAATSTMRVLHTTALKLHELFRSEIPYYAILSHQ